MSTEVMITLAGETAEGGARRRAPRPLVQPAGTGAADRAGRDDDAGAVDGAGRQARYRRPASTSPNSWLTQPPT